MVIDLIIFIGACLLFAFVFRVVQVLDRRARGLGEGGPSSNYVPLVTAAVIFVVSFVVIRLRAQFDSDQESDFLSILAAFTWAMIFLVWYWRIR